MKRALLTALFVTTSVSAHASDYVAIANRSWAALTCAALANAMPDGGTERERLFQVGYNLGKQYLRSRSDGTFDVSKQFDVPLWYVFPKQSDEFTLGFIWAKAFDVFKDSPEGEKYISWAKEQFAIRNCSLL